MKTKDMLQDIVIGIVLVVIGIILLISSFSLPMGNELSKGADFMPKIVSALLIIFGAAFSVISFLTKGIESEDSEETEKVGKTETIRLLISFLFFFCYIFLLEPIGFIPMTFLYIFAQSWFTTPKEKRRPLTLVAIAAATALIIYGIFVFGLKVMLPAGILG